MISTVDLYQRFSLIRPEGGTGMLDCYIQQTDPSVSACRLRPAVLILPGGGYDHVSAREGRPVAMRFLAAGYQAFVLRYSVSPVGFPHPLREAAMAMAYIRGNAEAMGINPHMVAAVGFSAGGHLCGMLGTMFDSPEVTGIGSCHMLRPDALGLCYPVAVSWGRTHEGSFRNLCGKDTQLRSRLSLERLAREDMPPVFLWHTRDDESVPCRNSLILAARVAELGVDCAVHIYRHGCHGLSTADEQVYGVGQVPDISPDVSGWMERMLIFFQETGLRQQDIPV